jgi:hypothetical protein
VGLHEPEIDQVPLSQVAVYPGVTSGFVHAAVHVVPSDTGDDSDTVQSKASASDCWGGWQVQDAAQHVHV